MTNEELVTLLDQRFARIDERFNGIDERFDRVDDDIHQTRVLVENLDDKVKFVMDDVRMVDGKLDRFADETRANFAKLEQRVLLLETSHR